MMKRLRCSLEILGGLRNRSHYKHGDAGQLQHHQPVPGSRSFSLSEPARPLFSIMPTDREPGTGYSIIQDVALFRNKPSYQVMTKDK